MDYFIYQNDILCCEETPIEEITKDIGTPVYVYSKRTIVEHYTKLKEAFPETLICYSVKASSNIHILKILKELGSGFDIVSGGELYRVLKIGADPNKIVYAGVGKTPEEIKYAIENNILMFNCESIDEILTIEKIAKNLSKKVRIAIRVNPDVEAHTHSYITTGKKENKFGIDIDVLPKFLEKISNLEYVNLVGFHFHIGSQITNTSSYSKAIQKVSGLISEVRNRFDIQYLNTGGGFGINYRETDNPPTAQEYAEVMLPLIKRLKVKHIIEPGRFIIGNAGILVTRQVYIKKGSKKYFIICDTGMNELIRPSLYNAYHKIRPVVNTTREILPNVDIVGPICESGDFFAKNINFPRLQNGELIAIFSAGAYGSSMASNYNSHPRAAEVLVDGDRYTIIARRQTYEDIIKREII